MSNNDDTWINVDKRSNRLSLRFYVRGFSKQFYISSGLTDTEKNRGLVRRKRDAIRNDIALEQFDSTLKRYQFTPANKEYHLSSPASYQFDLQELWAKFSEFQSTQVEETTILSTYKSIARCIAKLPVRSLDKATEIRNWLVTHNTQFMAWHYLSHFHQCGQWAEQSGLITENPFSKLKIQKPKKKSTKNDDYRAFTLEQRDIIIDAFENHLTHSFYAPLIKFLFLTGCRPGEAFALTWGDISDDCRRISITKSRNLHGILKGTKNGKRRIFPAASGSKLHKLLLDIKPAIAKPNQLLFQSKTGSKMTSFILNTVWNRSSANCPGVVRELVDLGKIPYYLKPYATRHTFATWAISSRVTPDKVSLWIGDEPITVLRFYCHPNVVDAECPDF